MTDLHEELEAVLAKAAECELLGSLAVERDKREEYRTRARFQRSIAEELRARLASPVVSHSLPHTFAG
jgi:hypothetical protein